MTGLAQGGWDAAVDGGDLLDAVLFATGKGGYARIGRKTDKSLVLAMGESGLAIASRNLTLEIPMLGHWQAPIRVDGPLLRRLVPKLAGPVIRLRFDAGGLLLNSTRISAARAV